MVLVSDERTVVLNVVGMNNGIHKRPTKTRLRSLEMDFLFMKDLSPNNI